MLVLKNSDDGDAKVQELHVQLSQWSFPGTTGDIIATTTK